MFDIRVIGAYFGPDGPYAGVGELVRRMRSSKFGRYVLAVAACVGLLLLLAPLALAVSSVTSNQAAASVFTPLFWIAAFLTWRTIVQRPADVEPSAPVEDSSPTTWRSERKMEKAIPYVVGILAFVAVRAMGLQNSTMILAGGLVGLLCGLLPYLTSKRKSPGFARTSLWVCGVSGMIGGALLGAPTAVVMTIIGYFKTRSSA